MIKSGKVTVVCDVCATSVPLPVTADQDFIETPAPPGWMRASFIGAAAGMSDDARKAHARERKSVLADLRRNEAHESEIAEVLAEIDQHYQTEHANDPLRYHADVCDACTGSDDAFGLLRRLVLARFGEQCAPLVAVDAGGGAKPPAGPTP